MAKVSESGALVATTADFRRAKKVCKISGSNPGDITVLKDKKEKKDKDLWDILGIISGLFGTIAAIAALFR